MFPTFKSKERQQADRDKGKETHHKSEGIVAGKSVERL